MNTQRIASILKKGDGYLRRPIAILIQSTDGTYTNFRGDPVEPDPEAHTIVLVRPPCSTEPHEERPPVFHHEAPAPWKRPYAEPRTGGAKLPYKLGTTEASTGPAPKEPVKPTADEMTHRQYLADLARFRDFGVPDAGGPRWSNVSKLGWKGPTDGYL